MKWRLQEGRGEAVYQIGVEDDGMLVGLSDEDMRASLKTLYKMAEKWVSYLFVYFAFEFIAREQVNKVLSFFF